MKHFLTILTLLLLFISCKEDKQPLIINNESKVDSIPAEPKATKVFIMDKSLYSKEFVENAKAWKYPAPIRIMEDYIEVEGEKILFPDELTINTEYVFTAFEDKNYYELKVTRYNPAGITYEFRFTKGEATMQYKGKADIGIGFFLASEARNDYESGDGFLADEYSGISDDGLCDARILIGEADEQGRLRAEFSVSCKNETQDADINSGIILRQNTE